MQIWDIIATGAIVVVAVWYLYRKFVVSKGCSCANSCSGCSSKSVNVCDESAKDSTKKSLH